ncbi:hypothetical protein AUK10_01615 [Candidatus Gracilibacteria bacterium CG2_30_37_12]|nr:MAG: hypothetical protein AUK10_01615 [Candidatus Gracilibacteria bacterium CG2_30_37_12]
MKQFFKWLGKHIAGAMVFSLFSILFIAGIVYALTYPSAPPMGEVAGGKFMDYFNKILVSTGTLSDGTVKKAANLQVSVGAAVGKVLTSDATGNGSWQDATGGGSFVCNGTTFCNAVHGTYSFPGTVTNWIVPVGVVSVRVSMKGGNGSSYTGGGGSFLMNNGILIMVSGGGGGSGAWDGDGPKYAGAGGVNGAGGNGGGGFGGAGAGTNSHGGNGGTSLCGSPSPGIGGVGGVNGTNGAAAVYWSVGGGGGHGGGASLEDFLGGNIIQFGGGGGGGYGGGGGGSGRWCGYSYSGGGGGGGGYRAGTIISDAIYGGDAIAVVPGQTLRGTAGNYSGYVTINW